MPLLPASRCLTLLISGLGLFAHAETPKIPILAWFGPPPGETTVERYRELADAGFTINFSSFPNADAMQKALDLAQSVGLRQMLSLPELKSDPEGTVKRFKDHPALAGYYLRDEPNAADFPALAEWVKRIQAVDTAHGCYLNLFPNYADAGQLGTPTYAEHLRRFVAEVPVPYISFDHYPVVGQALRPEWYENLEVVSAAAAKAGKPFWAFVLAVAHGPYPVPTPAHLRLQAFSDLAYGAQTIQYFTYWTPRDTQWNFHRAPIETDGKRTPVYDLVKTMNGEIQQLAPVFVGSRVLQVGHLGTIPRGTKTFEPRAPIDQLKTDGPALVSLLANGSRRHLVVVNRDLEKTVAVEVAFAGAARVTETTAGGAALADRRGSRNLSAGNVLVLSWEE